DGEEAALGEYGIEARTPVPLAEHEAIAVRPVGLARTHPQGLPVQHGEQLDHRKCCADVRAASAVDHVEDAQSQARAHRGKLGSLSRRRLSELSDHSSTAKEMYGSHSRRCSRTFRMPSVESRASVSPGHMGLSSSSNASTAPRGILGTKCSRAT